MTKAKNYKRTLIACYLGFITQAISANFAPLLFLTFKDTYGISLDMIALIPMVFYLTQLLVDLGATKFADVIGYRTCVVVSQVVSAAGLLLMAFLPDMLPDPFVGILISVVLYAVGSGLIEVLVSPIVEACPFDHKAGVMSLLHSFYCRGAVGVILGSTLFFILFGTSSWRILTVIWAIVPLANTVNFMLCPVERMVEDGDGLGIGKLLRLPLFWLMILLMVCAGASEGDPRNPSSVYHRFQLILERSHCKKIRFHDLRHTFATMALENGMDIKTLSAMIGHISAETTLNIYSHITDTMQLQAAVKIDREIGGTDAQMPEPTSEQPTSKSPTEPKFEPYKGKIRKPGTGCVTMKNDHLYEGRFTPRVNGKRIS